MLPSGRAEFEAFRTGFDDFAAHPVQSANPFPAGRACAAK
jgi:hypothetical protein